jgi:molybdopterin molybdotransferase
MRPAEIAAYEERYPLLDGETALQIILAHTPVLASETVPLAAAAGRVLATDLQAPLSLPPFPQAVVDGYAVIAADPSPRRRLLAEVPAGHPGAVTVTPGTAVRIMTGAPLPPGADAVVMVEHTSEEDGWVVLHRPVRPGDNIHPVGLDVQAGETVLRRGTLLGAPEIGLLATLGITQVPVYRQPVVAVLSTGDELVPAEAPLRPGAIRDSNQPALLVAVREAGGLPLALGIARDRAAEQEALIRQGLERADVVLTSGGVSVGGRDFIKPILERLGRVHFGRVAIKPGKPLTFATVGDRLVFGLPGNPVSSLVTFEVFVRPALRRLQGFRHLHRPEVTVYLEHPVQPSRDRLEFQRAVVRWHGDRFLARTTGLQASSRLLSLVGANALLKITAGPAVLPAGSAVPALLLGPVETFAAEPR